MTGRIPYALAAANEAKCSKARDPAVRGPGGISKLPEKERRKAKARGENPRLKKSRNDEIEGIIA